MREGTNVGSLEAEEHDPDDLDTVRMGTRIPQTWTTRKGMKMKRRTT
jgi:hypothetical protein